MSHSFLLFANLILPLISSTFFLFFFLYFVFAHPSRALSYRLFVVFLIAFSVFLFGRPLQLLLGPHPWPLIVVNIRVFILCSVLTPVIILMAWTYHRQVTRRDVLQVFLACLPLGLTYDLFNTLGTHASYVLFEAAGFIAYDNLTPSRLPPFYGREVTIAVQVITGLILFCFSFVRLRELWREKGSKEILRDKIFLINAGIIVFAASFILGSLAKQWWVYYVASVISASLVGSSVIIDIKELHTYYEKLVPLIKEEIIHNVAFSELSKAKLMDMLSCLGKKTNLNTFVLVKVKPGTGEVRGDISTIETISKIISQRLETAFSEDRYLILPLSDTSLGIVLYLPGEEGKSSQVYLLGVLEDIREEIFKTYPRELLIGIGRSYDKIEDLRNSYREALNASEYAEQIQGGGIIHVENITGPNPRRSIYPVREKEQLLSLIRSGDVKNAIKALKGFFEKFHRYIEEEPEVLKIRLYELVCSFIDAAILGGGDEKTLNECASGYLREIELIDSPELTECWLEKIVREIAGIVTAVYEKRSKVIIEKAKKYIEENYQSPLSYRDVARAVFISPSYFLSLFKRETGTTFVDYLTAVRIEKAKHTLLTTDLSITQIAYDHGFNNPNYFSNLFRKIVGVPASEFRKRG